MSYILHYWQSDGSGHSELRSVRLRSIEEAFPLALRHNRPTNCSLITIDRSDNQSNWEKIIWEPSYEYPQIPRRKGKEAVMTPSARKAMSIRMKKYWADKRAETTASTVTSPAVAESNGPLALDEVIRSTPHLVTVKLTLTLPQLAALAHACVELSCSPTEAVQRIVNKALEADAFEMQSVHAYPVIEDKTK